MFYIHIVLCELFSGISCDFESSGNALGWCYLYYVVLLFM